MKRILWITHRYPPIKGGMSVSCNRQVTEFRRRNHKLDVLFFSRVADEIRIEPVARDCGTDYHITRLVSSGAAEQRAWRLVQQQHRKEPYTHVVGFGANRPGHIAVTFAAWLGLPAFVLVRGNDLDRDWFDTRRSALVRESLSRATAVGAVSMELAARIAALFPHQKIIWTPNGVDVDAYALLPAEQRQAQDLRDTMTRNGERVIGIFGDLKYKKRIPLWLGALRDTGRMDQSRLLIVGRVDEETRQLLNDPACAPPNQVIPYVQHEHMPAHYAACDFIALPSSFDGMPNVLLEAMACGIIPITSDAGAMPQVIQDGTNGFLFAAEDRDDAARATLRALDLSNDQRQTMAQAARQQVREQFSIEQEIERLGAFIFNKEDHR